MSAPDQISIKQIFAPIAAHLERVEALVMENLETDIPLLTQVGQYILASGGKRVRPAMLLMAAGALGKLDDDACQTANIIEYIHTATLLHDDVVDNADLRRSQKSARSIWGNEASVLVGDYLFTVSFKFLAALKDMRMVEALSRATTLMARGEILQLIRSNDSATEEDYLEIVFHKTASLMGAAMEMGAILAGGDQKAQEAMYQVGRLIGMAFQLVDDALDYELDNQGLGKKQGVDLKERKITLPLSRLLQVADREHKERVLKILEGVEITDQHVSEVSGLIHQYQTQTYTLERAHQYAEEAKGWLAPFERNQFILSIEQLADFVVNRKK